MKQPLPQVPCMQPLREDLVEKHSYAKLSCLGVGIAQKDPQLHKQCTVMARHCDFTSQIDSRSSPPFQPEPPALLEPHYATAMQRVKFCCCTTMPELLCLALKDIMPIKHSHNTIYMSALPCMKSRSFTAGARSHGYVFSNCRVWESIPLRPMTCLEQHSVNTSTKVDQLIVVVPELTFAVFCGRYR